LMAMRKPHSSVLVKESFSGCQAGFRSLRAEAFLVGPWNPGLARLAFVRSLLVSTSHNPPRWFPLGEASLPNTGYQLVGGFADEECRAAIFVTGLASE